MAAVRYERGASAGSSLSARGPRVLFAYRLGATLTRMLPHRGMVAVAEVIGSGLAPVMKQRRSVLERNLSRVTGRPAGSRAVRTASRRALVSYVYYWMESFRLPGTPARRLQAHMSTEGVEHLVAGVRAGRGVIMALPHLGGWEYAGAWMTSVGLPMTVVVEPLDPPELFEWFVTLRKRLGMTVLPLGSHASAGVLRALHEGRVVGLLSDRDLAGTGVEVQFFGERTTLPGGPATLAIRTGAALLPTAVYSLPGGGHLGVVRPALVAERTGSLREDVRRLTQSLAEELEMLISRAPEQWHLLQPNWPSDRQE